MFKFIDGCNNGIINIQQIGYPNAVVAPMHIEVIPELRSLIDELSIPFLRRVAILQYILFSASVPVSIAIQSHNELLNYLQLPTPIKLFETLTSATKWVVQAWMRQYFARYISINASNEEHLLVTPAKPFRLLPLPHLYQEIFSKYLNSKCKVCSSISTTPALCLICGAIVCADNCTFEHVNECGCGVGMVLLINNTTVQIIMRGDRICLWGSPYLDEHGEEDTDLRRGKPLYLNEGRYNQLTKLWVTHGIEHDSHVLENTELDLDGGDMLW